MRRAPEPPPTAWPETCHIGADTPERLIDARRCPALGPHRIVLAGLSNAGRGYRFVRHRPELTQVMVVLGGRGEVWAEGRWRPCGVGEAYVSPARAFQAFRTLPRTRWRFCFALHAAGPEKGGVPAVSHIARVDPAPFHHAVLGLWNETCGPGAAAALDAWARLVDHYARQILAGGRGRGVRLRELWDRIAAAPERPWTLAGMARQCHVSPEHLRRLALREAGRSPLHQVAHLRMTHAVSLLRAGAKLEAVAAAVGYGSAFSFSAAFKKWAGQPPSAFRV